MTGVQIIAAERKRQIKEEGWKPEHDDQHTESELARVGAAYALAKTHLRWDIPWPKSWDFRWWKPSENRIRNLAKAGALIAAEIDRLQRLATRQVPE